MSTILVAEDDHYLQNIYKMVLESAGFEVILSRDGEEVLKALQKHTIDLMLLDLMMPVKDGAEVLSEMRQQSWGKSVPVIVLTNIGKSQSDLNINDYQVLETVVKVNLLPDDLVELVNKHLDN